MDIYKIIGQNVRKSRLKNDFTLEELAHRSGISASYLNHIELSDKKATIDVLSRIADSLNVPVASFLSTKPTKDKKDEIIIQISRIANNMKPRKKKALVQVIKVLSEFIR